MKMSRHEKAIREEIEKVKVEITSLELRKDSAEGELAKWQDEISGKWKILGVLDRLLATKPSGDTNENEGGQAPDEETGDNGK